MAVLKWQIKNKHVNVFARKSVVKNVGQILLTISEVSDPSSLTSGSVRPLTFMSPWLQGLDIDGRGIEGKKRWVKVDKGTSC